MRQLTCAGDSHPGLVRDNNEDRFHYDLERGILLVVDGVGGQAAGEEAADTALRLLRARLERQTGTIVDRIREAITVANNEIFRLSQLRPEWNGMACVLTVAVVDGETVTVGHVGDSRLYKLGPDTIRKITRDHSPIGEREDRGELTEMEAMRHPRRNEVYRDVGSEEHTPADEDFIEIATSPFETDAALLLCSDGLSDLVTSERMLQIALEHAGDPFTVVHELIEAANAEGGKDNITAVYAEAEDFAERVVSTRAADGRPGSAGIAARSGQTGTRGARARRVLTALGVLAAGIVIGLAAAWTAPRWKGLLPFATPGTPAAAPAPARELRVSPTLPADFATIGAALDAARPGDTIIVGAGEYREQVRLKDGVSVVSERPGAAVLRYTRDAPAGIAVVAENVAGARLLGIRVLGDADGRMEIGVALDNADVEVQDLEIAGARLAGLELSGTGTATIRANRIHSNGTGVVVRAGAAPWLAHNIIVRNGRQRGDARPGVELEPGARVVLTGNVIADNGAEGVWGVLPAERDIILAANIFVADGKANARGALRGGAAATAPERPARPR